MDPFDCPNQEQLAEFVVGNLPRAVFSRVAEHVEHCAACETALRALDGFADPLLARLRQARRDGISTADAVPAHLLAAARSACREGKPAAWLAPDGPRRLGKFELLEELG